MEIIKKLPKKRWFSAFIVPFFLCNPAQAMDTSAELDATRRALLTMEEQQQQQMETINRLEMEIPAIAARGAEWQKTLREQEQVLQQTRTKMQELQSRIDRLESEKQAMSARTQQLLRLRWLWSRHGASTHGIEPGSGTGAEGESPPSNRNQRLLDNRILAAQEIMIAEIMTHHAELKKSGQSLVTLRNTQMESQRLAQQALEGIRREEEQIVQRLAEIREKVIAADLEIHRLAHNAQILEDTIQRMQRDTPTPTQTLSQTRETFSSRRGRMLPPIDSARLHRFGQSRSHSGSGATQWHGEVYEISRELEVKAVHDGEVAFAEWMRGFGFLVILDHGEGFLSLYGHNRELMVQAGNTVTTGTPIARIGPDTPPSGPGLYFELRQESQRLNPEPWWDSNALQQ